MINQQSNLREKECVLRAICGASSIEAKPTLTLHGCFLEMAQKAHAYDPSLYDLSPDGECTYYGRGWQDPEYREYVKEYNRCPSDSKSFFKSYDMYIEGREFVDEETLIDYDDEVRSNHKDILLHDYDCAEDKIAWVRELIASESYTPKRIIDFMETILCSFFRFRFSVV